MPLLIKIAEIEVFNQLGESLSSFDFDAMFGDFDQQFRRCGMAIAVGSKFALCNTAQENMRIFL